MPHRHQRRRQDDDAQRNNRPATGEGRRDPLRRRERDRPTRLRARAQGPRHGPRGPRRLRGAHHRRKSRDGRVHPHRQGCDRRGRRASVRALPAPQGAPAADGRHAVGRRAADARDGSRADVEAEAPATGRAVDGTGAAQGAEGLRDRAQGFGRGGHHPADRAERQARARSEQSRVCDGIRADHCLRRCANAAARSRGPRRVSRRGRLTFPSRCKG